MISTILLICMLNPCFTHTFKLMIVKNKQKKTGFIFRGPWRRYMILHKNMMLMRDHQKQIDEILCYFGECLTFLATDHLRAVCLAINKCYWYLNQFEQGNTVCLSGSCLNFIPGYSLPLISMSYEYHKILTSLQSSNFHYSMCSAV